MPLYIEKLEMWSGVTDALTDSQIDLSDGKIFTTMEWLMVFVKVPL